MELRDLSCLDVEALTPVQAEFHIRTRTAQLLYARGNERGYDEKLARADGTQEVMRQSQFRQLAEEAS